MALLAFFNTPTFSSMNAESSRVPAVVSLKRFPLHTTKFVILHTLHTLTYYLSDNQYICLVYAAIILVYATPLIISILEDPSD